MPLKHEHVARVRRGRSILENAGLSDRPRSAIHIHQANLRTRVVIEKLLILGIFQQVFKRGPRRDPPQIFLDHGPNGHFISYGSSAPIVGNTSANQAPAVAQPFTRGTKNSVQGYSRQTPCVCRGGINDPKAQARIFFCIANIYKRDLAAVWRPGHESDLCLCRKTRHGHWFPVRHAFQFQRSGIAPSRRSIGSGIESQPGQAKFRLGEIRNSR